MPNVMRPAAGMRMPAGRTSLSDLPVARTSRRSVVGFLSTFTLKLPSPV
jgi:hypothetical protein